MLKNFIKKISQTHTPFSQINYDYAFSNLVYESFLKNLGISGSKWCFLRICTP